MSDPVELLILKWRDDPGGTYRSWFLWAAMARFGTGLSPLLAVAKVLYM